MRAASSRTAQCSMARPSSNRMMCTCPDRRTHDPSAPYPWLGPVRGEIPVVVCVRSTRTAAAANPIAASAQNPALTVIEEPSEIPGGFLATYQEPGGATIYIMDQSTDSATQ